MPAEKVTGADAIDAPAPPVPLLASGAAPPSVWWRRVRWSAVCAVLLVLVARATAWAVTPPVTDAEQRVQALSAARGGVPLAPALPQRIATAVLAVEDHRFYS